MADEFDDEFTEQVTPPPAPTEPEVVAPQHSPLALEMARELNISPDGHTPETLQAAITAVRQHSQRQQKPAAAEEDQDEPVNWGKNADGTPRTEAQFREEFSEEMAEQRRDAHEAKILGRKVLKQNEALRKQIDEERQSRNQRAVAKQLNAILAERPDLFGENPSAAKPGSPEHKRIQLVNAHLSGLVAAQQHTTLDADARAAIELFGTAPQQKKSSGAPSREDYLNGQLSRPTQRRHGDNRTARQIREEEIAAEQAAHRNGYVGVGADNDDLLDD